MAEPLTANSIERLSRALFGALAPITGDRASGQVLVTAGPAPVVVPRNTYLVPVTEGKLREELLYKTTAEVQIAANSMALLPIVSNVGGRRHNLPEATPLRFDPPLEGFVGTALLNAAMTTATQGLVRSLSIFEDVDAGNPGKDFFDAGLFDFPAMILAWQQSEPVEGVQGGLRRGSNRGARAVTFYRETFVLYVIAGRLRGPGFRRQEGLTLVQAAARLLGDRMQNDDGEQLSTIGGGVEIIDRARLARGATHYLY